MSGKNEFRQFTTDEALAFAQGDVWKSWDAKTIAAFQLRMDCLCIPFVVFHQAVEEALGRSVWTHEFGMNRSGLIAELEGKADAPTIEEILGLLPAEKTILIIG